MEASEVYLDENLLQKLIDKGFDHRILRTNPMRISLQEAKEWLESVHSLFIDTCIHTDSDTNFTAYSAEVRRIRHFEQVGVVLKTEKRFCTPEEAEIAATEFIVENILPPYAE